MSGVNAQKDIKEIIPDEHWNYFENMYNSDLDMHICNIWYIASYLRKTSK